MIKHDLIKKLSSDDEYIVAISYIKHDEKGPSEASLETTVFTNDFPGYKIPSVRVEIDRLMRTLESKLNPEAQRRKSEIEGLNNQVKGLIE